MRLVNLAEQAYALLALPWGLLPERVQPGWVTVAQALLRRGITLREPWIKAKHGG